MSRRDLPIPYNEDIMREPGLIHVGTSGWHYKHWQGPFYPDDIPKSDFLDYYADRFHTVEINNSFYRLPEEETLIRWRNTVPSKFVFAVKASRYITHMKKLKDPQEPVSNFLGRIDELGDRLGPILFQLPPNWKLNPQRLQAFLQVLPTDFRYAFEFRDPSWFHGSVYDALGEHGTSFCIYDFDGRLSPREVTAEFIYIRLHGPSGPYQGQYETTVLEEWASHFSVWAGEGKEIYCYFDNDEAGYAVQDALRLKAMFEN
jgi:uncharacterized protein YecE (DUF72 family)